MEDMEFVGFRMHLSVHAPRAKVDSDVVDLAGSGERNGDKFLPDAIDQCFAFGQGQSDVARGLVVNGAVKPHCRSTSASIRPS
ncbi:hypothetical protein [Cupriavidus necator]|uniref:hypothetical protein n=1 Tax=Cupriavidus necator TaxID=106590 RepID=UPI000A8162CB|nr:hypothetical protein [Cupriavidus necator]